GPLQRGEQRLTLFELLRGHRHTLLLFPGARTGRAGWLRLASLADSIQRAHKELVDVHVVAGADEPFPAEVPPAMSVVRAPEGALRRRYAARAESLYLIRPDGYVGYRSAPALARPLRSYLARIFVS